MSKRKAFTMVEVLSVVVIISSLMAILAPALANVKKAAKGTVCLSNLRQIGLATRLYMVENDDAYPQSVNPFEQLGFSFNYGTGERDPFAYPTHLEALAGFLDAPGVWRCPVDQGRTFPGGKKAEPALFLHGGTSYVLACLLDGQTESQWVCPTQQPFATDGNSDWHTGPNPTYSQKRVNALYYDGHVGLQKRPPRGAVFRADTGCR